MKATLLSALMAALAFSRHADVPPLFDPREIEELRREVAATAPADRACELLERVINDQSRAIEVRMEAVQLLTSLGTPDHIQILLTAAAEKVIHLI